MSPVPFMHWHAVRKVVQQLQHWDHIKQWALYNYLYLYIIFSLSLQSSQPLFLTESRERETHVTLMHSSFPPPALLLQKLSPRCIFICKISTAQTGNFKDTGNLCSLLFIHYLLTLCKKAIYSMKRDFLGGTNLKNNSLVFSVFSAYIHLSRCLSVTV